MNNFTLRSVGFILILTLGRLHAVPLDATTDTQQPTEEIAAVNTAGAGSDSNQYETPGNQTELQATASEQKTQNVATASPNSSNSGNIDPSSAATSLYASFLTPEAIQQYMSQFGAAYPGFATYPGPIAYAAAPPPPPGAGPIYPGPYVVQTGYEGYLVPSTSAAAEGSTATQHSSNSLLSPFTYLTNLFSMMMMSALFRVVATVLGAIGMIFFGGALTRFICSFTPICNVTNTAVEYLKSERNAERVGRMIAEGMTPERVRRASAFVQNALMKYQELQKLVGSEEKDD